MTNQTSTPRNGESPVSLIEASLWRSVQTALQLSRRQVEVAELLFAGRTRMEIADHLGISLDTVRSHIDRLYGKVDVRRRSEFLDRLHNELFAIVHATENVRS